MRYIGILLLIYGPNCFSYSFDQAIEKIKSHESVEALNNLSKALGEEGGIKGSWGDPMFKVAAKNYPKSSLKNNETAMTGMEFGVSQKIALSTKYGNIKNAFQKLSVSEKLNSKDKQRELMKMFWHTLLEIRKLTEEKNIFQENLEWFTNTLKVSKKLYANGKISQQALLDIQIRKSEIEADLSNKEYEVKEQNAHLSYLLGFNDQLDFSTIPWSLIENVSKEKSVLNDAKEIAIENKLKAKSLMLTASKQNYIPDVTVSLAYTKRANVDGKGDFVSGSISFPLPFSESKYSGHSKAIYEKESAKKTLANYRKFKSSEKKRLQHVISRLENEIKILKTKTVKFATNS